MREAGRTRADLKDARVSWVVRTCGHARQCLQGSEASGCRSCPFTGRKKQRWEPPAEVNLRMLLPRRVIC